MSLIACEDRKSQPVAEITTDLSLNDSGSVSMSSDVHSFNNGSAGIGPVKLFIITEDYDGPYWRESNWNERSKEVKHKLESFINSGGHTVVRVNTIYSSAYGGEGPKYLSGAEIFYK